MTPPEPRRVALAVVAAALGSLLVCTCVVPRGATRVPASDARAVVDAGPRMDHVAHAGRGLDCADCHLQGLGPAGASGVSGISGISGIVDEPRRPTYAACAECHDDEDAALPAEKKVRNVFFRPDGSPAWSRALVSYDPEVIFRHAPHARTSCVTCHGEMAGRARAAGRLLTMDGCTACHAEKRASNACETCHRVLRQDVAPPDHAHLWKERHGLFARSPDDRRERRCDACHVQPQWCESCHGEEAPRSHTNLFRLRTHGVMAAVDRDSCRVCHTTDSCVRCHEETPPRSHRGSWEGPVSTHCLQCHFPIRTEDGCRVCHREEPRHETAPDMPPDHNPKLTCRMCHNPIGEFGAPPLRHVDNGMACIFCHH